MKAEYFKCDLHIHSDASNETKESDYKGSFCLEKLEKQLEKNGVKLFSITDHNQINEKIYREYYEKYDKSHAELLIGVEFDIHPEIFLIEALDILISGKPVKYDKYHSLVIFKTKDIARVASGINKMYKEVQDDFKNSKYGIDLFCANKKHRLTSLDRIITNFNNEDFLIISHGAKSSNIVKTYKGDITTAQAMILLGVINSVEVGPTKLEAVKHFNKGFEDILKDDYKNRSDVPYVVFSDNHELDYYPHYDSTQVIDNRPYTWIRGVPCFETLRLSFVDPSSRIVLSEHRPAKPLKYLSKIKFETINAEDTNIKNEISLTSGINTIIGGRSSGKSLLLNSILHNIIESRDDSEIISYTSKENNVIDISTIEGVMNTEGVFLESNNCRTIAYTQDKIVSMFKKDGLGLEQELPFIKYNEEQKRDLMNISFNILDNLAQTYEQAYKKRHSKKINLSASDLKLSIKKKSINYTYTNALSNIKDSIVEEPTQTIISINLLNALLENIIDVSKITYDGKLIFDETEIDKINELKELLLVKSKKLRLSFRKANFKKKFLVNLEDLFSKELLSISSDQDTLITKANIRLKGELAKAKDYINSKHKYRKAISSLEKIDLQFESLDNDISEDYKLRTEIIFKLDKEVIYEFFKSTITQFDSDNPEDSLIGMIYGSKDIRVSRRTNEPHDFKELIQKLKIEIQQSLKPKYSIIEKGISRDLSSDHMSPGKKASVYLEIILTKLKDETTPTILIIDQPEDNLDNMFITEKLVEHIRNLRGIVQVIIVTHNASIAINTDSDNITIAKNDDSNISYESDGLENLLFREDVCKLLDGGHHTFDQRYHKYDIPNRKIYEPLRKDK